MTRADSPLILIADHQDDSRFELSRSLQAQGYRSLVYANRGSVALAIVREQQYDFILIDVADQETDGPKTIAKLRQLDSYREVPILAMGTGKASERTAALEAGADDYLATPIDIDTLILMIEGHAELC